MVSERPRRPDPLGGGLDRILGRDMRGIVGTRHGPVEAVLPTVASYLESRQTQASIADRSHQAIVKARNRVRGPSRVKTKSRLLQDYRRTLELAEAQNRLYARTLRSDVEFVGRLTRLLRNLVGTLRQINTVGCTLQ